MCDDEKIIRKNIIEFKLSSPDYVNWKENDVIEDFERRIDHYQKAYESITADELDGNISFVKVMNIGNQARSRSNNVDNC